MLNVPKNGAATYIDIGPERLSSCHKSLRVPLPVYVLKLGAEKKPAKKRRTTSVAMFRAKSAPRIKSAKIGRLMKTTGLLPKLSESSAAKGPPKARPK